MAYTRRRPESVYGPQRISSTRTNRERHLLAQKLLQQNIVFALNGGETYVKISFSCDPGLLPVLVEEHAFKEGISIVDGIENDILSS